MSDTPHELQVSFSSFIVSLASSAMMHLGEAPDADGARTENLPLAKNTIDVLGVLREKTQGNLDDDEQKLLDAVLYETRMKYLQKQDD